MPLSRTTRRAFVAAIGAAAWPLTAHAQRASSATIGFLRSGSRDESAELAAAFVRGLKETGYVEGQNVAIEYRWGGAQYDILRELIADLVSKHVAVIFAGGAPAALAAKSVTSTVPIVFTSGEDAVTTSLVTSLNKPGGNITGVSLITAASGTKRFELLRALIPQAVSIALLVNPRNPNVDAEKREAQTAAALLRSQIVMLNASSDSEIDAAIARSVEHRFDALAVSADAFLLSRRTRIVALAGQNAIPAIYPWREYVTAGGLMSYGTSIADAHRLAGIYVGRILNGEKPGELPVQLPTRFEFVINLKTAKTLGLVVPPTVLARADEVIE
jgi:putative ABC transport system substrate-binding protein